jgi:hypothetical protein
VMGLKTLQRSAEVSHWGANLNIEDQLHLVNYGPKWATSPFMKARADSAGSRDTFRV